MSYEVKSFSFKKIKKTVQTLARLQGGSMRKARPYAWRVGQRRCGRVCGWVGGWMGQREDCQAGERTNVQAEEERMLRTPGRRAAATDSDT